MLKAAPISAVLMFLSFAGPSMAQDPEAEPKTPSSQAELPQGPRALALKRELRTTITSWMRARQTVLLPCERCQGTGEISRPRVTPRGLVSVSFPHPNCHGTGLVIRMTALRDLYRPYLKDARSFPALGTKRMDSLAIRDVLSDQNVPQREKAKILSQALGLTRGSAQVRTMSFELLGDEALLFATVETTIEPFETRWVRIKDRWFLVGTKDERILVHGPDPDDQFGDTTEEPPVGGG